MNRFDNNGNFYPSVYTRNTTNSPTHIEEKLEAFRARPFAQVPFSAYFDSLPQELSVYNPWKFVIENRILPLMDYRSTLPVDSAATSPDHELVFVYDIEEITTISANYSIEMKILNNEIKTKELYYFVGCVLHAAGFCDGPSELIEIVHNIEDILNGQREDLNQFVPKFIALKTMYNEVLNGFDRKKSIISDEVFKRCKIEISELEKADICQAADELQKVYNQRWKTVDKCLKLVKKRSEKSTKKYANVVLSRQGFVYGAGQMIVSGHAAFTDIDNVYSTKYVSKAAVFERIQRRFGQNCTLIYITSYPQRALIPEKLNIPIWHVTSNESIRMLYQAQRDILLR